jgi:ribonuclease Z
MASKIKITFLGTADAVPTIKRNHTSILLTYNEENILIDCGEGTQRQFRKAGLNPCKVTRILLTHWHGDHVLGLPGLLQTLSLSGYNKTLFIYGPSGTKKFIENILNTFIFHKSYQIKTLEVDGKVFETTDFEIKSKKVHHGVPCNAYSFAEKQKIRIDKTKLKKSKLPSGPLLQKLKEGKDVIYEGKKYLAKNLTFKEDERKISFVLDTLFNKDIIPFVENSDVLVSEATFDSEIEDKAREHKHLTARQAGEIAKKSKSKKLFLTHVSQRYEENPEKILKDAKTIFKNSHLVNDLDVLEI